MTIAEERHELLPFYWGTGVIFDAKGDDKFTAQEVLQQADLDWDVCKMPVTVDGKLNGERFRKRIPGSYATVRSDNGHILANGLGERYQILQNREALNFMDDVVDSGDAKYVAAGSTKHGQSVFIVAEIPQEIKVAGIEDETVRPYLLLRNTHDGSGSVVAAVTLIRPACSNMVSLAIREAVSEFRVRHTQTMHGKILTGRDVLGLTFDYVAEFESEAIRLADKKLRQSDLTRLMNQLVPVPELPKGKDRTRSHTVATNTREEILRIYNNADNLNNIRGTAWGWLNAVVEYDQHVVAGRDVGEAKDGGIEARERVRAENRMTRIIQTPNTISRRAYALVGR